MQIRIAYFVSIKFLWVQMCSNVKTCPNQWKNDMSCPAISWPCVIRGFYSVIDFVCQLRGHLWRFCNSTDRTVNKCEALVNWYHQGKTKLHGENLSHYHVVQHKSWLTGLGLNPGTHVVIEDWSFLADDTMSVDS